MATATTQNSYIPFSAYSAPQNTHNAPNNAARVPNEEVQRCLEIARQMPEWIPAPLPYPYEFPKVLFVKLRDVTGREVSTLLPLDPRRIIFDKPKKNNYGRTMCEVSYHAVDQGMRLDTRVPLLIQTPTMNSQWGLSIKAKTAQIDREQISIDLGFYGMGKKDNVELLNFFRVMQLVDEALVRTAIEQKNVWFAPNVAQMATPEFIRTGFYVRPLTRIRKGGENSKDPNAEYVPALDLTVRRSTNGKSGLAAAVFGENRLPVPDTQAALTGKNLSMKAIIKCTGVNFNSYNFRYLLSLEQALLVQRATRSNLSTSECAFVGGPEPMATTTTDAEFTDDYPPPLDLNSANPFASTS